MNKRTHIIYLVIIASLASTWFVVSRQKAADNPVVPKSSAGYTASPLDNSPEAPLEAQVEPATIANLEAQQPRSHAADQLFKENTNLAVTIQAADVAALVQQQVIDHSATFEEQDYDTDWSYTATQQIADLFALHTKELAQFSVLDIACKSSICQIKTDIDGNHFMQIMQLQKLLIEQDWYGSNSDTTFTTNDDGLPYEIYISIDR